MTGSKQKASSIEDLLGSLSVTEAAVKTLDFQQRLLSPLKYIGPKTTVFDRWLAVSQTMDRAMSELQPHRGCTPEQKAFAASLVLTMAEEISQLLPRMKKEASEA